MQEQRRPWHVPRRWDPLAEVEELPPARHGEPAEDDLPGEAGPRPDEPIAGQ